MLKMYICMLYTFCVYYTYSVYTYTIYYTYIYIYVYIRIYVYRYACVGDKPSCEGALLIMYIWCTHSVCFTHILYVRIQYIIHIYVYNTYACVGDKPLCESVLLIVSRCSVPSTRLSISSSSSSSSSPS